MVMIKCEYVNSCIKQFERAKFLIKEYCKTLPI